MAHSSRDDPVPHFDPFPHISSLPTSPANRRGNAALTSARSPRLFPSLSLADLRTAIYTRRMDSEESHRELPPSLPPPLLLPAVEPLRELVLPDDEHRQLASATGSAGS